MTGPAMLRYQRLDDGGPGVGREFELQRVMAAIGRRLAAIGRINTREHDEQLDVIEVAAAPYALALYYEVRRLEMLLRQQRFLRQARASRLRAPRRDRRMTEKRDAQSIPAANARPVVNAPRHAGNLVIGAALDVNEVEARRIPTANAGEAEV